jgi:hypothetical protein
MTKEEMLKSALVGREDEILHYQINIDNYQRAIVKAQQDPELADFVIKLEELLSSSRLEQKKAIIIRDVICELLGG